MPKPTGTMTFGPRAEPTLPPTDDGEAYDTLAQLFLGEIGARADEGPLPASNGRTAATPDDAHAPPAPRPADLDTVECLILGHLPVLGSAWVSQYARCIAADEGVTVGLVQVRAGYATVEVIVADDDDPIPQPPQARPTLESAIDAAAAVAGRWILRVEEPDEPAIAAHPLVSTLTLLTSADEMAVVAAYRTLKRLLGDTTQTDAPDDRPEVRVSIMGAPAAAADAVFAKLSEAARMFIHRPIERAPGVHRVHSAGPSVVLFSGPVEDSAGRTMQAIAAPRRRSRRTQEAPPTRPAPPRIVSDEPPALEPTLAHATKHDNAAASDGPLATHLRGLTPLPITCPYSPEAQFATDGAGRLHILARHDAQNGGGLEPLTIAAAWAIAHRALLEGIEQSLTNSAAPPSLHIFVDDPREVRRLLDADLHVHLLASVTVEGRTGWLCRDLN